MIVTKKDIMETLQENDLLNNVGENNGVNKGIALEVVSDIFEICEEKIVLNKFI